MNTKFSLFGTPLSREEAKRITGGYCRYACQAFDFEGIILWFGEVCYAGDEESCIREKIGQEEYLCPSGMYLRCL